jgi:hypothetical protein
MDGWMDGRTGRQKEVDRLLASEMAVPNDFVDRHQSYRGITPSIFCYED